jgi:hypothetical protein
LHICEKGDLPFWIGKTLWLVEYKGTLVKHDNKSVVRSARLVKQLKWGHAEQVEFAYRAAERVLPFFEKRFLFNTRPRNAILAARTNAANAAAAAYAANAAYAADAAAYAAANAAANAANAAANAAYAADAAAYAAYAAERLKQADDIVELAGG